MAPSDLKLIEPLLTLLGVRAKSFKGHKSERISEMHRSCKELFERAKKSAESINLAKMDWDQCIMSGPSQRRERMEYFLRGMENISSGYDMELDSVFQASRETLPSRSNSSFRRQRLYRNI